MSGTVVRRGLPRRVYVYVRRSTHYLLRWNAGYNNQQEVVTICGCTGEKSHTHFVAVSGA